MNQIKSFSWFDRSWWPVQNHLRYTAVAITYCCLNIDNLAKVSITSFENPGVDNFVQANAQESTDTRAKSDANVSRKLITVAVHQVNDKSRK